MHHYSILAVLSFSILTTITWTFTDSAGNVSTQTQDVLINDKKSYNVIIGPEGDFSDSELNTLDKIKPITINLGPRRLRSETSAIVGLANLNQILNY